MKVGTSMILGVGGSFSDWGWYGHLGLSGKPQICYAGRVINQDNNQMHFSNFIFIS